MLMVWGAPCTEHAAQLGLVGMESQGVLWQVRGKGAAGRSPGRRQGGLE